ncbi:gamma-tubulin complex component 4 homolog [Toxorhynchites rutilus septentrionalis]|uniref:gamma-tubulin complex component 4 homolog n=1 Tax=Toxorhynchites rutilus septentrionalis TaxID=329112 RepID=UPI0024788A71|nr:gamma-tubulin complex component 4 homolog [Toxorhynchites rutilus septentrionalis]
MIHDILFTLFSSNADLPIENFTIPEVASSFLHPGEIKILEDLIRIANQYKELKKFIHQYGTQSAGLIKPKQLKPTEEPLLQGLYLQAFADGLDLAVKPYRDLIVQLEANYLKRPNLSLIFIYHQVNQYQSLFGFLLRLVSGVVTQRIHGCALLQYLQQHCLRGNDKHYQAVRLIQNSVYAIFIKQLFGWLLHGKFVDQFGEFFIQHVENPRSSGSPLGRGTVGAAQISGNSFSDNTSINTELWRYEIRREILPYYFPASWAEKVLFIGQTVLMLISDPRDGTEKRLAGERNYSNEMRFTSMKESLWGEQEYEFFKKFHRLQLDENMNVAKFEHIVDEIKLCVSEQMSEIAIKEADLLKQLKLIKDYFMLGRGELFSELLKQTKSLRTLFAKGITDGSSRDLNRAFQLAANSVNITEDIEQFSFVLPPKDDVDSFCYETKGILSYITLKYKVKWPLHLLFSPKTLEKYNEMFRFLLRVRKIQYDIHQVWSFQRENRIQKKSELLQFRNKLMFLIDNLQYYLQVDVLESQFSILMGSIWETKDFEKIQRAHTVFQANVLSLCFLLSNNSPDLSSTAVLHINENPVLTILDTVLVIVDKFCSFCGSCKDPMTTVERQEFDGYEQAFNKLVDSLLKLLIGLKAGPSSAPLSQLLLRLDFNYWFSNNTQSNVS